MIHKYKAWDKKEKLFVPLGNHTEVYFEKGELIVGNTIEYGSNDEFNRYELLAFTGLTDIHDEELYYKDFVVARDIRHKSAIMIRGWIDYDDGSFCINNGVCKSFRWIDYGVEKICNILENPELLEGL